MIAVGVITMIIIVYSSFSHMQKQQSRFEENLTATDSLYTMPLGKVGTTDSLRIGEMEGHRLLVFWASWSDKSESMLSEIQILNADVDSLTVLAALVKDAEESLPELPEYPGFIYVDGARMFNSLKVPGIPSYVLIAPDNTILHSNIGYQKGSGYDSLKVRLQ